MLTAGLLVLAATQVAGATAGQRQVDRGDRHRLPLVSRRPPNPAGGLTSRPR